MAARAVVGGCRAVGAYGVVGDGGNFGRSGASKWSGSHGRRAK